ncbi:MerR family transcriptional regulator [Nocardioides kongjuensis]|uniref:DNA-binding transcriptional MerR regulator n=1 Tax=Nocardioides kongjuensis TaxID=349522 RepID=A0A852RXB5_9ACTN|nr:DNA-binding transcriptional MerR regulator [Nocardioides kongjuensis]
MLVEGSTAEVAAATGYSPQQVRNLEALGVIPPAPRTPSGYRQFSAVHVRDLVAYRDLALAVGPVVARRAMRDLRALAVEDATALVGSLHAGLGAEREQALAARAALVAVSAEACTEAPPVAADSMTITELSDALGVRASTLRFWEREGLLAPERIATPAGAARRYPVSAVREARIVVALRAAGYRVPEVRSAIGAVRELGDTARSLTTLDARLATIAQRVLALMRAGAVLAEMVSAPRPPQPRPARPTSGSRRSAGSG